MESIRPSYGFDVSCRGTVPEAVISFLDAGGYEDAVRNAVSLGGDSDTLACIAGGITEAYYGPVAGHILDKVKKLLTADLLKITDRFCLEYRPDMDLANGETFE